MSTETRREQTRRRQRDKRNVDDLQTKINQMTNGLAQLEELKTDRLEELLADVKDNDIPDNTKIELFNKSIRVRNLVNEIKKIITKKSKTEIEEELSNLEEAINEDDFVSPIAENILVLLQNPFVANETFAFEGNKFNAEELTTFLQEMIEAEDDEGDSDFSF